MPRKPPPGAAREGGWGGMPAAPDAQLDGELVRRILANPSTTAARPSPSQPQQTTAPLSTASGTSATDGSSRTIAPQPFDVFVVLDFEATCEAGRRIAEPEVVELPMILIDARTATPLAEFQRYVRPVKHPVLSAFCTELTGITQEMVSSRDTFPVVYREALQFLAAAGLGDAAPQRSYCVVTCGDWDLKTMLPAQMRVSGRLSIPLSLQRWCNLKVCMAQLRLRQTGGAPAKKPSSMPDMLEVLGLPLQGRHHSGIDDCRNIAAVLCELLKRGHVIDATYSPTPFTRWHAAADAPLPSLETLSSSLADAAVAVPSHTSQDSVNAPPPPPPQPQQRGKQSGVAPSRTAASSLRPYLVVDASRNAVEELLSAGASSTPAGERVFSERELKTVSKFMSTLLRHKALQWRVPITVNGYVLLDDLLRQPQMSRQPPISTAEICQMVRDSDKQRFRLAYGAADGRLYIAAAQGHSMDGVEPDLRALTTAAEVPVAVHGTYWDAWKAIQQCGYLSPMTRQHIHFAKGLVGDAEVISGMRHSAQVLVYLDTAAALADGVALYESSNGVVLTPGVGDTRRLPLTYVAKAVDRRSGRTIYPL
ncbi:phosphotransferase [Novymonas esmeraldas]|uniref:2'-phosphotransferase n=1 Tax=Novymonas esmeraldas TaxID=1808958 RepID=A0AAW0EKN7_9TRYP